MARWGKRARWVERVAGVAALATIVAAAFAGEADDPPAEPTVVAGTQLRRSPGPTTTTTAPDLRTLKGFNHYRATVTVPTITVYDRPHLTGAVIAELPQVADLDTPQTFLIKREQRDPDGTVWYDVLLPVPPNGSTGWIRAEDVHVEGLDLRLEVNLSEFTLRVFNGDRVARVFEIGVGTVDTPTPGGDYYVREAYELTRSNSAYGSHALGLNGFSTVLDYWRGGGIIGIHGTNRPESIGSNASHGCIRMRNEDVAELFPMAPRGTPVTIVA